MVEEKYKKIMNAVDLDYLVNSNTTHTKALSKAIDGLKKLDPKKVKNIDQGIEIMVDSLIQYRKEIGSPVSADKKHRHYYISEVRSMLQQYAQNNNMSMTDVETMFKKGEAYKILNPLLEGEKRRNYDGFIEYKIREHIPSDIDIGTAKGLAKKFYETVDPFSKPSEGEIASMANPDQLVGAFKSIYDKQLSGKAKQYKPKEDKKY